MLARSFTAFVKGFGCRPLTDGAAVSGGRRPKACKGGNRDEERDNRAGLWGFGSGSGAIAVTAGRADGWFDAAGRTEQIDAVERGFVDRGRLIELQAARGDVSECLRGRRQIGAKEEGLAQ